MRKLITTAIASKAMRQVVKIYNALRIFSIINDSKRKKGPQSRFPSGVFDDFPSETNF